MQSRDTQGVRAAALRELERWFSSFDRGSASNGTPLATFFFLFFLHKPNRQTNLRLRTSALVLNPEMPVRTNI